MRQLVESWLFSQRLNTRNYSEVEKKPLVTIITPSFNQDKYLEATIKSVLGQDYPHIEYFIVDGGSTDGSIDIIRKYKDKISWWVSEKDNGQGDAINKGMTRASGDIIAWVNSDDLYLKGAISKAVEAIENKPDCGFVFSNVLSIDADTKIINTMRYGNWGVADLASFKIIGQPSVFMNRKILEETGFLDETYNLLLDPHLWLRIALKSDIYYIDDYWAAARYHSEAKNSAQGPNYPKDAIRLINWMKETPEFRDIFRANKNRIYAGAYDFSARYLLDSGLYRQAFIYYLRSFLRYPPTAAKEFKRILFSFFGMFLPIESLRENYIKRRIESLDTEKYEKMLIAS